MYLSEFGEKYKVGTKIRTNKYVDIDGLYLEGKYIFEIPQSNADLANIQYFKDIANEYNVELRFFGE